MKTIRQNISDIRTLIKQVQNDSLYPDQFLYSLLRITASKLQYQRIEKYKAVNDFNWQTFCIPLIKAKSHDCDCVQVGCDVLKSVNELPRPLIGANRLMFKVLTLGEEPIPKRSAAEIKTDNEDDIKAGEPGYMIRNNRLVIWNNVKWKAVQVSGIWEDPTEWIGLSLCDEDGSLIPPCQDVLETNLNLDGHLVFDMYRMVLSLLRLPLNLVDDMTSDSQPEIKA